MLGTVNVTVTQVATKILCTASPTAINADNVATSLITARVSDPGNALVSTAANAVLFTISGQGTLQGTTSKSASSGVATVRIKSTMTAGTAAVTATSSNLSMGTVAVTTSNLPAITGLSASGYGKFNITMTWNAGTYLRFKVERALNSGFTSSSTTLSNYNSNLTQATYADTGLTAGTSYWYRVYGYGANETLVSAQGTAVGQKTADAENKFIASVPTDVVHGTDVKVSIPAGTFSADSYIEITPKPVKTAITNANSRIVGFLKPDSNEIEINVYSLTGGAEWEADDYNHNITLRMYYKKSDMEAKGIIEDTLKLFVLNEDSDTWEKADSTQTVNSGSNPPYVKAVIPHLSVYCLMGSGEELEVFDLVNFPNPFGTETVFSFVLTMDASEVVLGIYTISGRLIKKFDCPAGMSYGHNQIPETGSWDGTDGNSEKLANGVYIYKVTATPVDESLKPATASGKLMIVR
jgi:hypothetical protein